METLVSMFPDCDKEFLKEILQHYKRSNQVAITRITEKLIEFGYPKQMEMNSMLLELLEIYPNMDIKYAREQILKYKSLFKCLKVIKTYPVRKLGLVSEKDLFRDQAYIDAVRMHLLNDYPFHWESTIKAVMAETNNDYQQSFQELSKINPPFLFKTLFPFTRRRHICTPEMNHPILVLERLQDVDKDIAYKVNVDEYQRENQLITCQCCFSDSTFEELCQCTHGHLFCHVCVRQYMNIGMYDTGSMRGKILHCLSSDVDCEGCITLETLKTVLPLDLYSNYESTLFKKSMDLAGLTIYQCPSCNYFEEAPIPNRLMIFYDITEYLFLHLYEIFSSTYVGIMVCLATFTTKPFQSIYILTIAYFFLKELYYTNHITIQRFLRVSGIQRLISRPNPIVFNCKNPQCLQSSCTSCQQVWEFEHKCYGKEKDSLRTTVELAMSQALIRTCPSCNIRFSKVDGCNKMQCPYCKYIMCYVCRQDIGKEKYAHFCEHFRLVPGTQCTQCTKCDLYQKEADHVVVRQAAIEAEKEWRLRNPDASKKATTF